MKILTPALTSLLLDNSFTGFHIGHMEMLPYFIEINFGLEKDKRNTPLPMPSDYELKIWLGNSLIDKRKKQRLEFDYELLPDLRDKIIHNVTAVMGLCNKSEPIGNTEEYFETLSNNQKNVMKHYVEMYGLTQQQQNDLHMFFSPNRVVAGLTEIEVKMCIELYPYRRRQIELCSTIYPRALNSVLTTRPGEALSRTEALKTVFYDIFADIVSTQPPLSRGES
jgi:hypothetical protein